MKTHIPGLNVSYSRKRAFGVTRAKRKAGRALGIPLSFDGLCRLLGRTILSPLKFLFGR